MLFDVVLQNLEFNTSVNMHLHLYNWCNEAKKNVLTLRRLDVAYAYKIWNLKDAKFYDQEKPPTMNDEMCILLVIQNFCYYAKQTY